MDITEKIHPKIIENLNSQKHSLGNHPAFPVEGEQQFDEELINNKFKSVIKTLKKYLDIDEINPEEIKKMFVPLLKECMSLEKEHREELEQLAIDFVKKEFDMPEEEVEIKAKLMNNVHETPITNTSSGETTSIILPEIKKPVNTFEFNDHEHKKNINGEIYKRRLVNVLSVGASNKLNKILRVLDDEITDISPRLPNLYAKIIAIGEYMLFTSYGSKSKDMMAGNVKVNMDKGDKTIIDAKAMIFPVLVSEISKGAMTILSENGLPENDDEREYIKSKADLPSASSWDERLGFGTWGKLEKGVSESHNPYIYKAFVDLIKKPVNEFNECMQEIFSNTKKGKLLLDELCEEHNKINLQKKFDSSINEKRDSFNSEKYITSIEDLDSINLDSLKEN